MSYTCEPITEKSVLARTLICVDGIESLRLISCKHDGVAVAPFAMETANTTFVDAPVALVNCSPDSARFHELQLFVASLEALNIRAIANYLNERQLFYAPKESADIASNISAKPYPVRFISR